MDPNVQVAIATVVGTTITTLGVIIVALISSRRNKDDDQEDPKPKPNEETFALLQSLILENARKEKALESLKAENVRLRALLAEKEEKT